MSSTSRITRSALLGLGAFLFACADGPTGLRTANVIVRLMTPATVASVTVEVSGPGITPAVIVNIPVGTDSMAWDTLMVTAGSGRRFVVTAVDTAGVQTHRADTTITLVSGTNAPLVLRLEPLSSTLGITVTFGGVMLAVADTATRALVAGDTIRVAASALTPAGEAVPADSLVWGSSNPAIATVSNGLVTGARNGSAMVTVSYRGAAVRIRVVVGVAGGWTLLGELGIVGDISNNSAFDGATGRIWVAPIPFSGVVRQRAVSGDWSEVTLSTSGGDCVTPHFVAGSASLRIAQCNLGAVYGVALDGTASLLGPGAGGSSWFGEQDQKVWAESEGQLLTTGGYGDCSQRGQVMAFGSTWSERVAFTADSPIPRGNASAAVDTMRRRYYLFGGHGFNDAGVQVNCDNSSRRAFNDLWRLDLATNTWQNLIPPTPGPISSTRRPLQSEMALCESRNEIYIFVTNTASDTLYAGAGVTPRALYRYRVGASTSLEPLANAGVTPSIPFSLSGSTLVCDESRSRLLLIQGTASSGQLLAWPLSGT